ncbi:MAG: ABC transporter permease [Polyangiaceae bacterium]
MRALWLLIKLRLLDTLRSPSSTGFVFLFPIVLLVVVGVVFMNGHPFERRTLILVDTRASVTTPATADIRAGLAGYDELFFDSEAQLDAARGKLASRMASAVLVLSDSGSEVLVGPRERLFGDGLARALQPKLGKLPSVEVQALPRFGYVHYLFPGLLTFSVLLSGLFGMGYVMVSYRQSLFLKKLATTPLSKSSFVLAQILSRSLLVLGQNALLLAVGHFGFGLPLGISQVGWLTLVSSLGLLTFMGLGFVLACVIRTEELMMDIISSVNVPIVFLSELFFPLAVMPRPLALVGGVLPSTQMVRLCREVLLHSQVDAQTLLPGLGVLLAWTAATFGLSLLVFRWQR